MFSCLKQFEIIVSIHLNLQRQKIDVVLVFLLLNLNILTSFSSDSATDSEQIYASWVEISRV